jgi:hypothetical protein
MNTVEVFIAQPNHVTSNYRDLLNEGKKLNRLIEFLDKYVPANKLVIEDEAKKVRSGKRRKSRMTEHFTYMTDVMTEML